MEVAGTSCLKGISRCQVWQGRSSMIDVVHQNMIKLILKGSCKLLED